MTRTFLLLTPLLLATGACGPRYGRRVPDSLVERLPYEARIELLEAENALALAIDRVDEAASEKARARDAIRRAKARQEAAEDELDRAADPASREVARLTIEESKARVKHLRARQQLNVGREELAGLALRCAWAHFELERLATARKAKVAGSEKLDPKRFESQAAACDAQLKKDEARLAGRLKAEETAREAWEEKRTALARKTFDARASPYVENLP